MTASSTRKKNATRDGKAGLAGAAELRKRAGYAVNDEGFTILEYCNRFGLGYEAGKHELEQMVKSGAMVCGQARRKDGGGQLRRMRVFRPK